MTDTTFSNSYIETDGLVSPLNARREAAKVPLDADFQALEDLVEAEKAKKEKKVVVEKKV